VLFRNEHQGHGYIFESDEKDVEGTASRDEVIQLARSGTGSSRPSKPGPMKSLTAQSCRDGAIGEPEDEMKV
jgi:hypothetical protein